MRLKKIILFLTLMLLTCLELNVDSMPTRSLDNYRIESIHKELMSNCNFIHEDNFRHINRQIFSLMISECDRYDLPYSLFFSVVDRESGFQFIQNSEGSGAIGYMQLMPKTFSSNAQRLGLKTHTPENNVKVGAYHLHYLFSYWKKKYHDDETAWTWALAQYAVGLGGMQIEDSTGISYQIPESVKPGIDKILRNYNQNL